MPENNRSLFQNISRANVGIFNLILFLGAKHVLESRPGVYRFGVVKHSQVSIHCESVRPTEMFKCRHFELKKSYHQYAHIDNSH